MDEERIRQIVREELDAQAKAADLRLLEASARFIQAAKDSFSRDIARSLSERRERFA